MKKNVVTTTTDRASDLLVAMTLRINFEQASTLRKLFFTKGRPSRSAASSIISYIKSDVRVSDLRPNILFDPLYYLTQNPDVYAAGVNPLLHFVERGIQEGRSPHPLFDLNWYVSRYGSAIDGRENAFMHFLDHGARAMHDPHALFDANWYAQRLPAGSLKDINPLVHFLQEGAAQGLDPHPLFSTRYYLDENPDVAAAGVNPLAHYVLNGWREGRNPHPLFDNRFYLKENPDVAAAKLDPLRHYLSSGASEGRNPHPMFFSSWYDREHSERVPADVNPLVYFCKEGAAAGHDPSPSFSCAFYAKANGLDAAAMENPLLHYVLAKKHVDALASAPEVVTGEWHAPNGSDWEHSFRVRLAHRLQRLKTIDVTPPLAGSETTFSIITTVYDTPPSMLSALAESLREQAFEDFEWVILDNGSTRVETIDACRAIADSDERFRLYRVESNIHIIGGNRFAFECAQGAYVVPIDSDDILYPDSLALFAETIRTNLDDLPVFLFSDEHKITTDGEPHELLWRDDYTFAHAMSTVPAAHLSAFSRALGKSVGVYSDDYARGSHDWDTALRITERGGRAIHIPEVLYGWRMHEKSTAFAATTKTYINNSQTDVLLNSLRRRKIDHKFSIEPLFLAVGYYQAVRSATDLPKVAIDFVIPDNILRLGATKHNIRLLRATRARKTVLFPRSARRDVSLLKKEISDAGIDRWIEYTPDDLASHINKVEKDEFCKFVFSSDLWLESDAAVSEAVGVLELDTRAGIVGGLITYFKNTIQYTGLLAGLDGFVGSPFFAWAYHAAPPHLFMLRRRVTAFPALSLAIRADLLRSDLVLASIDYDDAMHGIKFCLDVASRGYNIVYEHAMRGSMGTRLKQYPGAGTAERLELKHEYAAVLSNPGFSPHLSRVGQQFGSVASKNESRKFLNRYEAATAPAIPLNLQVSPALERHPSINVLLPAVRTISLSGGPNTALNLVYRLAELGFMVRIMSTDHPPDRDLEPVWQTILALTGRTKRLANITIVDASNRAAPFEIGSNDIFFATAWWTAVMANAAAPLVEQKPFIYLIQDFEPILYAASSSYALAHGTYDLPHIPVVNTGLLSEYLIKHQIGRFKEEQHVASTLTFEPAIDRKKFFADDVSRKKRRLLFYARPTTAARNLFEVGIAALRAAIMEHVLDADRWDIVGMGEAFVPVDLGYGATLQCAPWLGLDAYAEQMRTSDILVSLMLSPHPSYPPLEMAGCGGLVVTNTYATKTAERLEAISKNIIAVDCSVAAIADGIKRAVMRLADVAGRQAAAYTGLPSSWDESFATVTPALAERLRALGISSQDRGRPPVGEPQHLRLPMAAQGSSYESFLQAAADRRASNNVGATEKGLFSFVSTVWNTAPAYLEVLMRSLKRQLGGVHFEWVILDNGTTREDTLEWLGDAARQPFVKLSRAEHNLGIIGGMRHVLERATGRYILPLDSDDYIYPDCVRTLAWYAQKNDYPPLMYTDEDKLIGEVLDMPFTKPDWDPVLFSAQCYIAHLCVIDRKLALELGAYTDKRAEGSHDWDTFTRFYVAGHRPLHVPHLLYSWRLHPQSTAGGNMDSKPVVFDSQRAVLERFLAGAPKAHLFELCASPLFNNTPDWWLRRRRRDGRPITTVRVRPPWDKSPPRDVRVACDIDHDIHEIALGAGLPALRPIVEEAARAGRLVHIIPSEVQPDDDEWAWEAIGLMDLFPDTVAVGGRSYSYDTILEAGRFLGFANGCGCPDRGRPLKDPGYSAQMWKPRSVDAVSAMHAVFEPEFLLDAISRASEMGGSIAGLGNWIGAEACRAGKRVIYSPFICAWTGTDWDSVVDARERQWFAATYIDLMTGSGLRPSSTGSTAETAYSPVLAATHYNVPPDVGLPAYAEWTERVEAISTRLKPQPAKVATNKFQRAPLFSLLTPLYFGSDAGLFESTASSLFRQSHADFEWIVLMQGPASPALETVLEEVARDPRVRLLRLPENLGIMGGMRHVLEAASGTYTISLDGDDLLAPGALASFADAIDAFDAPDLLYSDEDIIVGTQRQNPFLRPGWDPVLDLENSWIWHLCALKRSRALELGVYDDRGSEYCHDWDSVDRFVGAGVEPVHVRKIAYSWRHHDRSTSNTDGPNELSGQSVRHVLQRKIERLGLSQVATVADYPIWRGAKEFWISRKAERLPPLMALVAAGAVAPRFFETAAMPPFEAHRLRDAIAGAGADTIIGFLGEDVVCQDDVAALEVVKLFECVPDVAAVTGRISVDGKVRSAGYLGDGRNGLVPMLYGKDMVDPGAFALAWKAQCIAAPASELFFVRAPVLDRALECMPSHVTDQEFGLWLGAFVAGEGGRVCFSPLVSGEGGKGPVLYDCASSNLAWEAFCKARGVSRMERQGDAAYWRTPWS